MFLKCFRMWVDQQNNPPLVLASYVATTNRDGNGRELGKGGRVHIPTPTERSVFAAAGLHYLPPWRRGTPYIYRLPRRRLPPGEARTPAEDARRAALRPPDPLEPGAGAEAEGHAAGAGRPSPDDAAAHAALGGAGGGQSMSTT